MCGIDRKLKEYPIVLFLKLGAQKLKQLTFKRYQIIWQSFK
jgi:hypothetical protein